MARTLESFARQEDIDNLEWELLLIDNNSTDATRDVARRFEQRLPLRYLFEPMQGLSAARNRALQEFRGELLVFTDDDVLLDESWLAAWAYTSQKFPEASYFGGRILPLWEENRPNWLVDPSLSLISGLVGLYDLGAHNRWFNERDPLPFGANFALRRSLVESLQPFRLDLGVIGGSVGRGEETEYIERARTSGTIGAYIGNAVCYHTQSLKRFRLSYLYQYGIEKGRTEVLLGKVDSFSRLSQFVYVLRGVWQLLIGRADRFRQCVINLGIKEGFRRESNGR